MKRSKSSGFTLIELLVVFIIISILMGIGYASFNEIIQNRTLQKAEKELRSMLYQAKQGAFYGKKPVDTCSPFNGNKVGFSNGITNKVFFNPICSGSELTGYTKTLIFDKGIVLTGSGCDNFNFNSVDQGTSLGAGGCTFTLTINTKSTTVTVDQHGEIK